MGGPWRAPASQNAVFPNDSERFGDIPGGPWNVLRKSLGGPWKSLKAIFIWMLVCAYVYIGTSTSICVCMYTYMHIYMDKYTYVYIQTNMYIYIYMYARKHACILHCLRDKCHKQTTRCCVNNALEGTATTPLREPQGHRQGAAKTPQRHRKDANKTPLRRRKDAAKTPIRRR